MYKTENTFLVLVTRKIISLHTYKQIFEKLNIKFCKYLLGVNKKSTNILEFLYLYNKHRLFVSQLYIFCKTLNIDMNLSKTFGRNKFKNELKKTLKHKFLSYWNNIKQNQGESGKLSTYFQFKTRFTTE